MPSPAVAACYDEPASRPLGLGARGPRALEETRVIDRAALAALYEQYGPVVYRRARTILRDDEEARDAMQEVFTRVVARHHEFRGDAKILTWIYRITTNLCLNRLRQKRAHPVVDDPDDIQKLARGDENALVSRRAVLSILQNVDPLTQQIAVYYYLDEMKMEEVAEQVGYSRKTVSKKLEKFRKRAHAMLRDRR